MRIGIISDTHDRLAAIDLAFDFFVSRRVDLVVHCGDWKSLSRLERFLADATKHGLPVRGVLGNNDKDPDSFIKMASTFIGDYILKEGVLEIELDDDSRLAVYHGHHAPTLRKVLANDAYSIVMLGHTHKPKIVTHENKLVINPGSTAFSIPRSKTWSPSVAIVDTDTHEASINYLT